MKCIDTLIYQNVDNFIFNDENINKFPQFKYIFKKNENNEYYVNDIINLNFEKCN